jgi:hypothetical protein
VNENIYMITINEGIDKSKNISDAGSFSSPAISTITAYFKHQTYSFELSSASELDIM